MKKNASILLAVLMLAVALTGCGGAQGSPEAVVKTLVDAVNAGSVEGVASCLDPESEVEFGAVVERSGGSMGTGELADLLFALEDSSRVGLRINRVTANGDAEAIVDASFTNGGQERTTQITCIKIENRWYVTGVLGAHSSPEGVLKKFVDSLNAGSMEDAISCMTPDIQEVFRLAMKLAGDSFDMQDLNDMMGPVGSIQASVRINGVQIDGDNATVNATITNHGYEETSDIPCVRVKGKWYLDVANGF